MKKYLPLLLAFLLVAVPVTIFVCSILFASPTLPSDCAQSEYMALTDPAGHEQVFRPEDPLFLSTAALFSSAVYSGEAGETGGRQDAVLLEWIAGGHARPFWVRVDLSDGVRVTVTDAGDRVFDLPSGEATLDLLCADAVKPLLVGEMPPLLSVGGKEVTFSVAEWRYEVPREGTDPFELSSGEYLNRSAAPVAVSSLPLSFTFPTLPSSVTYTVYEGEERGPSSALPPDLSALPPGDYQIVVVATWQAPGTRMTLRAGYTLLFSPPA